MPPEAASPDHSAEFKSSHLGLWDAVSIIVGIVIGAGIYETAPFILTCVSSPGEAMLVWLLGGVLSMVGALCFAELATTYPKLGGDYYFLKRAFGGWAGWLFSWSQLSVIRPGNMGLMAFVFADYAVKLFGANHDSAPAFAAGAMVILSLANIFGLKSGQRTQNTLTILKVVGISAIVVAGLFWPAARDSAPVAASHVTSSNFGLAMILVLFTYGGWNDAAFVVAEMKDKRRNIPRALILGTAAVAVIYLLVNGAYLRGLGFDAARESKAIAADVLHGLGGETGVRFMSLLVMISALGALNGMILTGARIYAAAGEDFPVFAPLSRWHPRWGTPVLSVVLQGAITLVMIFLVGTEAGRALIDAAMRTVHLDKLEWSGHGGFDALLKCTSPVFWLFLLMTALSLFRLRVVDRDIARTFEVPLFPVLPIVFVGTCGWLAYEAIRYAEWLTLLGLLPVGLGLVLFCLSDRKTVIRSDGGPSNTGRSIE